MYHGALEDPVFKETHLGESGGVGNSIRRVTELIYTLTLYKT